MSSFQKSLYLTFWGQQPTQPWLFFHENYTQIWSPQSSNLETPAKHTFSLLFFKLHNGSHTLQGLSLKGSRSLDVSIPVALTSEDGRQGPPPTQTGYCYKINEDGNGAGICLLNALKTEVPVLAFPKRPLELSLASLEIEGTFSCLSLPLLTGVKGLERSSQKDREGIIKREEKESDRRSAFFLFFSSECVPQDRAQGLRVTYRHLASRSQQQFDSHSPEQEIQRKLKGTACRGSGAENRHNRNLSAIGKFHWLHSLKTKIVFQ